MGEKGLRRGVLALGCVLATAAMAPAARAESFFSSSSFLNTPLAADAPLDPSSTTMVADLNRQVQTQINDTDVHDDPNVSYNHCTTPVYRVPAGQPGKYVTLVGENAGRADMQSQLTAVPIPDGATADTSCSDSWLMVYQQSTDTLWELAGASYDSATGAWTAIGGAQMGPKRGGLGVSQSLGVFDKPYGVSGTGLAFLAGPQTIPGPPSGALHHTGSLRLKGPKAGWG